VIIVGYPSEVGHRNMDARVGVSRGPDTFREIMELTQLPSDPIDQELALEKVMIFDAGNI
jgi:hypothetical protein